MLSGCKDLKRGDFVTGSFFALLDTVKTLIFFFAILSLFELSVIVVVGIAGLRTI